MGNNASCLVTDIVLEDCGKRASGIRSFSDLRASHKTTDVISIMSKIDGETESIRILLLCAIVMI